VPPLRHSGLRISPTRARPVPFCRHGFLPLPLTSARFFVMCVPRRSAAFACTTDSHTRSPFTRPPNTSSRTSTAPTFWFSLLTTSSCIKNSVSLLGFWLLALARAESQESRAYFFPFFGFSTWATLIFLDLTALRTTT